MLVRCLCAWLVAFGLVVAVAWATESTVVVTAHDDGRTLTLQKGQELELRLNANRSTGYGWTMALNPSPVLMQDGDPVYDPEETPGRIIGAGSVERWRFHAEQPGRRTLRMEYRRPWEREVPPAHIVTLRIVVE